MVAAKVSGHDIAFLPDPFHDECGLFNADGTPGELFLPWRTTALALSGRDSLGTLRLPGGSHNQVFANKREAVMVLWNSTPIREFAYLGDSVRRVDVWGRESKLPVQSIDGIEQQVIEVGPEPVILKGLNAGIVRWCLAFEFDEPRLESLFGREQGVGFRFDNVFEKPVNGEATFVAPQLWNVPPRSTVIRLMPGEQRRESIPLLLKADANSGPQQVRIDFRIIADEEYRFSVHRTLIVGLDDIAVDLDSHVDEAGDLIVKAHVTNRTGQLVSFRSVLFAPLRRREQQQLLQIGPELTTLTYRLPRGQELVGQDLRLRLEELGGSRVLNQHLKVER